MKEIVLDTETTGISLEDGHRIVEIGCIELDDLIPTKNRFHCYLNPERKVSEQAFKVHGYGDNFLSKQKKFNEVAEKFLYYWVIFFLIYKIFFCFFYKVMPLHSLHRILDSLSCLLHNFFPNQYFLKFQF